MGKKRHSHIQNSMTQIKSPRSYADESPWGSGRSNPPPPPPLRKKVTISDRIRLFKNMSGDSNARAHSRVTSH